MVAGWLHYSYRCQPVDYSTNPRAMRVSVSSHHIYILCHIKWCSQIFRDHIRRCRWRLWDNIKMYQSNVIWRDGLDSAGSVQDDDKDDDDFMIKELLMFILHCSMLKICHTSILLSHYSKIWSQISSPWYRGLNPIFLYSKGWTECNECAHTSYYLLSWM